MKNTRPVLITALFTIVCFLAITYVSCTKPNDNGPEGEDKCANVTCQNGGYCVDGTCFCVLGFEGKNCGDKWISKYLGSWDMYEKVILSTGSFDTATVAYRMEVKPTGSNVTFSIDNFAKNSNADGIGVQMNGTDTFTFNYDQLIPGTDTYLQRGSGKINVYGTVLTGFYTRQYVTGTSTVVTETVKFIADKVQ